jgi:hypothetical protein
MGFTKIAAEQKEHEGFVPSTSEDLKKYARAGRRAKRARQELKEARKGNGRDTTLPRLSGDRLRQALVGHEPFKIYSGNLYAKFIEAVQELGIKKPRYRSYIQPASAAQ